METLEALCVRLCDLLSVPHDREGERGEAGSAKRAEPERLVELAGPHLRSRDVVPGRAVRSLPLSVGVDPRAELLLVLPLLLENLGVGEAARFARERLVGVLE